MISALIRHLNCAPARDRAKPLRGIHIQPREILYLILEHLELCDLFQLSHTC